jgi:hypothetical protein
MWTRIVSLAALAALMLPSEVAFAQQPGSSRCSHPPTGSLWSQVDWLRLSISGGRIALTSTRCGQTRLTVEPTDASACRQALTVDAQAGALLATYEAADDQTAITLSLDERKLLTIVRRPLAGDGPELRYLQPSSGPVRLSIGSDDSRTWSSASLWHLLLAEPAAREHLLPVLEQIRPSWRLSEQLTAVEAALVIAAGTDTSAQRRQWQAWIDQLADPSFPRRCEADQALRVAGQGAVAYLRQLDPAVLDLEQRRRIRAILAATADSGPDSPERVAGWLANDKRVWLALLGRGDERGRQAAARHLSLLCGKPVAIDPAASDDQRAQQLIELNALLAER